MKRKTISDIPLNNSSPGVRWRNYKISFGSSYYFRRIFLLHQRLLCFFSKTILKFEITKHYCIFALYILIHYCFLA